MPRRTLHPQWLPQPLTWHRMSHSDPDAAEPVGVGKVSVSRTRVFAAQSWVTGPELLAPVVVSRHKVRKCIGQGSWEGGGAASLSPGRKALGTIWVANPWSEVQSLPDAKHPVHLSFISGESL